MEKSNSQEICVSCKQSTPEPLTPQQWESICSDCGQFIEMTANQKAWKKEEKINAAILKAAGY